jgi:hypothetical protein
VSEVLGGRALGLGGDDGYRDKHGNGLSKGSLFHILYGLMFVSCVQNVVSSLMETTVQSYQPPPPCCSKPSAGKSMRSVFHISDACRSFQWWHECRILAGCGNKFQWGRSKCHTFVKCFGLDSAKHSLSWCWLAISCHLVLASTQPRHAPAHSP